MRDDVEVTDALLLTHPSFLDLRAPVEFARGAVPGAVNVPILDDAQRAEIGTVYAEAGQDAAIERGLALATPPVRSARLQSWQDHVARHPNGFMYCFRGGLRSRTAQTWLQDAGVDYPLVKGGYKALRRHLLNTLERLAGEGRLIVVSGETGCGKTELIHAWPQSLDLEGCAQHRGSAFGGTFTPQPSQIDFENRVALDWLTRSANSNQPVLIEAESQLIGRLYVPDVLQHAMAAAPSIQLDATQAERIARLRKDYVDHALSHFATSGVENPHTALTEFVVDNLQRIRRRLGAERTDDLAAAVPDAVAALARDGDTAGFDAIIETLLTHYYDKLYQHKAQKRQEPPLFQGNHEAVLQWLREHCA